MFAQIDETEPVISDNFKFQFIAKCESLCECNPFFISKKKIASNSIGPFVYFFRYVIYENVKNIFLDRLK